MIVVDVSSTRITSSISLAVVSWNVSFISRIESSITRMSIHLCDPVLSPGSKNINSLEEILRSGGLELAAVRL